MSATTTLANIFFGFWWALGENFISLLSLGLAFVLIYYLYYFMFKR